MAQNKKTFIFYSDWINLVKEMPDKDAGELIKHILMYVNDENPETENILVKMAFGHMKPLLKSDLDKWESIIEKRKEAGRKGGKQKLANAKQVLSSTKQLEAVNDNVNVNVINNIPDIGIFFSYALRKRPDVDELSVKMKYESWKENGWKDNNGKEIKNWKTKLLNTLPYLKKADQKNNRKNWWE